MALLYVVRCGQCSLHCLDDVVQCFIACVIDNYTLAHVAIDKCFSSWVPQRGVRGSERRKCAIAEELYWQSQICVYELNSV
jgi:hypothetical protein